MSDYIKDRIKNHRVIHEYSGKRHFFKVISDSGEEYNVSLELKCNCRYHSVQGSPNGELCSHAIAVMQEVVNHGHINKSGGDDIQQMKRNECANLVRSSNRKINEIRVSPGESKEHQDMKTKICVELISQGKNFISEAIFETGGRADILVLDDFRAIEIMSSENEESIEEKRKNYPKGLKIDTIKVRK